MVLFFDLMNGSSFICFYTSKNFLHYIANLEIKSMQEIMTIFLIVF